MIRKKQCDERKIEVKEIENDIRKSNVKKGAKKKGVLSNV